VSNHQKTITSVKLASASGGGFPGGGSAPRLLSASLDGHVKVYEINDFKVRHWGQLVRRQRRELEFLDCKLQLSCHFVLG
jgi:hypothetical protein